MKHLSPFSANQNPRLRSEIVESDIFDWHSVRTSPRYLSVPATQCHRNQRSKLKVDYVPRVCQIDSKKEITNVALGILKYQLSDRAAREKHSQNIRENLERRLQVAKSEGNFELVNILQDEYQQLEASCRSSKQNLTI